MDGNYTLTLSTVPPMVLRSPTLVDVGSEYAALNGEVPSMTVTLENGRGQLTGRFADPPLRALAKLQRAGVVVFIGRVQAITLAAEIMLTLES